ncbi:putative pilus assembly protein FilE [Acinetobacter chinensis]|jgi:hypothetical protein|uniref:putative pilus assembly protein FilE n=1 Tax=Acinetobacter chinensis TaxID=2004650 RepID=UPI002934A239|nr:putative pilus assembly protein FilE [Acinetobacter chinensis]WOE41020.1 putative pilus assembly protein FilE [Acinetobacter chinensis]
MNRILFSGSVVLLSAGIFSAANAAEFYTIIGPDGRPMVVQRKSAEQPQKPVIQKTEQPKVIVQEQPVKTEPAPESANSNARVTVNKVLSETVAQEKPPVARVQAAAQKNSVKPAVSSVSKPVETQTAVQKAVPSQSVVKNERVENPGKVIPPAQVQDGFAELDGEKYVTNELLENREFNLEGKKRFYAMPEGVIDTKNGGGARLQIVEREKGVSRSLLNSMFNRNVKDNTPVVLATTYYRVPQQEAVDSLGQQCFTDKKVKKAKSLKLDSDVNVWPRAPLKDHFDYEVIHLEGALKNIQINSYAASQQKPEFYWPFVVFLDEKACVLEGAGGFKSQNTASNMFSHEVVQGVVQLPEQTRYILLTPLASALDMENQALANHGQLKLVAIR